MEIANMMEAE
jgi:hypothetical protein